MSLQGYISLLTSDLLKRLRHLRIELRESLPRQAEQEHAGLRQTKNCSEARFCHAGPSVDGQQRPIWTGLLPDLRQDTARTDIQGQGSSEG